MDEAARDPDAERKRIVDAFGGLGVKAGQLTEYLGHDIGTCSPKELVDLRGLYGAIKDGEATWASVMENKAEQGQAAATDRRPTPKPPLSAEAFDRRRPHGLEEGDRGRQGGQRRHRHHRDEEHAHGGPEDRDRKAGP
jgi:hypothetical protein